ncbi:MAG TPA: ABC transporter ATP-binding protein [Xanthobacteraceae bacterium]|jgi:branched-chain amino acid transport system ATP-binding protein|nr:ABC transporter ATP-binding protein [Xanthobacteraceae bacterium]
MLELENINAYYGDSHILHGVSLCVREGEIVCLLGRNGAGKTTTILTVMGYLQPRPGRIRYRKRDIAGLPPYAVARLGFGFVPQERGIFPSLTVRENLTVFARTGGKGFWTLARIFDLFPVLHARERNLGFQLSGGEQQMLSIARALMLNPAMLLLDEPSEGLAPMIVQQIIEVLARLKKEGLAILLVEQSLRTAFAVGDRHHVMNKGEICFTGSAAELESNDFVLRNYLSV